MAELLGKFTSFRQIWKCKIIHNKCRYPTGTKRKEEVLK